MKVAYAGIDLLAPALETLIAQGCEIMQVFTCKTDNITEFNFRVRALAARHGIPCTDERIRCADLERLRAEGCELFLCGGYYHLIPIVGGLPMVNIHPAYLPEGRGAWPMPVAIARGLKQSGVTLHKMDAAFDTGDILLQRAFPLLPDENLQTFMEKLCGFLPELVTELISDLPGVMARAVPQGAGSYWACPTEKDWTVTSEMTAAQADLILRAFYGYECVYLHGNEKYEMIRGCVTDRKTPYPVKDGYLRAEKIRKLTDA